MPRPTWGGTEDRPHARDAGAGLRIGVLSDIHGNAWALDAVLAELDRAAVDEVVNLGAVDLDGTRGLGRAARLTASRNRIRRRPRRAAPPNSSGRLPTRYLPVASTRSCAFAPASRPARSWMLVTVSLRLRSAMIAPAAASAADRVVVYGIPRAIAARRIM